MNKNILVTGIEGFIGSNFALQAKKKDFNVIGLNWTKVNWNADEYKNYLYKITKAMELESVVHFGAIASTSFIDKQILYGFNVEAVQVIADFCALRNTPLVFTSSAAVYGNADNNLSPYAQSKLKGEWILKNTPSLKFVALRLFNTYGFNEIEKKDMKSLISDMIISGLKNKKISIWKFGDLQMGSQSRDFINVLDVNDIILSLITSSTYLNETLDLGSGESYRFIDIANFIASLDHEITIELIDPPIEYDRSYYQKYTCADMLWLKTFDKGIEPIVPFEKIPELIEQYKAILNYKNML
jgi:ADP-L-glycero-D-manno-heptose 6-epimerase